MECIHSSLIKSNEIAVDDLIIIEGVDETQHIRALRLRKNERLMMTNAEGITCLTNLVEIDNNKFTFRIKEVHENYGESKIKIGLALGILDDRARFEYAIEKAVELGVSEIFPLICEYSSKKNFSINRLNSKALAAVLQSKRSQLPKIYEPKTIPKPKAKKTSKEKDKNKDKDNIFSNYELKILADESGKSKLEIPPNVSSILIFVGPEGGFSYPEIEYMTNHLNCHLWRISPRRLRSETAASLAIGLIEYLKI